MRVMTDRKLGDWNENKEIDLIKEKKFVLIPRDAFELLSRRFVEIAEATEAASVSCAEDGQSVYVVEMRAVATRADRPVKVTKL